MVKKKHIINEGSQCPRFNAGDKVSFHYEVRRRQDAQSDDEETVDRSRDLCGPFELLLGKKFLIPAWEDAIKTMKIGETALFSFDASECEEYPKFSSVMRQESKKIKGLHDSHGHGHSANHSCAAGISNQEDMQDLYGLVGQPLDVQLELLSVEESGEFKRELWAMTPQERVAQVPKLKADGNAAFKCGNLSAASQCYFDALAHIAYLETLQPEARKKLDNVGVEEALTLQVPCLLNYSACLLKQQKFVDVIKHTSAVLKIEPSNTKAYFRRGQAHLQRGRDLDDAIADLKEAWRLCPNDKGVKTALQKAWDAQAAALVEEKKMSAKMFGS